MSVTWVLVERGSRKMGWRGEEAKERLHEREEEEAGEFPLQSAR